MKKKFFILTAITMIVLCVALLRLLRPVMARIDSPLEFPGCSNELLANIQNQNGTYSASLMERDCGATTNFVRSIYIRPAATAAGFDNPVTVADGIGISRLRWKDNRTLEIFYDPKMTKFFIQQASQNEFKIFYISEVAHGTDIQGVAK